MSDLILAYYARLFLIVIIVCIAIGMIAGLILFDGLPWVWHHLSIGWHK